jgi:hypothetical protein
VSGAPIVGDPREGLGRGVDFESVAEGPAGPTPGRAHTKRVHPSRHIAGHSLCHVIEDARGRKRRAGCTRSGHAPPDSYVWSGRVSQEVSSICRLCGLASTYPASDWSIVVLRAIMDISAPANRGRSCPSPDATGDRQSLIVRIGICASECRHHRRRCDDLPALCSFKTRSCCASLAAIGRPTGCTLAMLALNRRTSLLCRVTSAL